MRKSSAGFGRKCLMIGSARLGHGGCLERSCGFALIYLRKEVSLGNFKEDANMQLDWTYVLELDSIQASTIGRAR